MRRIIAALLIITISLLATGCLGSMETDESAFVLAVGFDKSKKEAGKLDVTFQVAVPRALASEGAKPEDMSVTTTVTVDTLGEARGLLNSMVARAPSWSHTKVIIIGDELAKQGLGEVLGPITRFREFRGSMLLLVVNNDTAQNLIKKHTPKVDALPSRYYETMLLTAGESGYYIHTNLHEFYVKLKDGSAAPVLPLAGLNKFSETVEPLQRKRALGKADAFGAGNIPRASDEKGGGQAGTPVEIIGAAVFHKDKMAGILSSQETRMMEVLRGNFEQGYLAVEDPLLPQKTVSLGIRLGEKPKLKVDFSGERATLTADVFIEAEITNLASGTNYEMKEYRTLLEEQISQSLRRKMLDMLARTQTMKSDVVGFGYVARTKFRTQDEYQQLEWDEVYSQADVEVKVTTRIRRTGLMWKTLANQSK